jgi:hypothetical protein
LAFSDAGFVNDARAAGVPVLDVPVFKVAALLEAGACASKVEHKTVHINSDFI